MIRIQNTYIGIHMGDITELEVDAIVNPVNTELIMNTEVASTIVAKGGKEIEQSACRQAPLKLGEATITKAGSLKAKYIIHTANMGMDFKTNAEIIARATQNSLIQAEELGLRSIAFPAMGTGAGNFSPERSVEVMVETVVNYLRKGSLIRQITFAVIDDTIYHVFSTTLKKLVLPSNILAKGGQ